MREASFIIPCQNNRGEPLAAVHDTIKQELADQFGGYTSHLTHGGWIDRGELYDEKGVRYTVALDLTLWPEKDWQRFAMRHADLAEQVAVYIVYDGNIEVLYI